MEKFFSKFESPSNIAIVKYWGKKEVQLPLNPSFSFTLKNAKTITSIELSPADSFQLEFFLSDLSNEKFASKLKIKIGKLISYFPWINKTKLLIQSENTFPHSAGIASSASSMSAIALCLCDLDIKITKKAFNSFEFNKLASEVARLLSGSASRSIYPYGACWGKSNSNEKFHDEYAIGIESEIHETFKSLKDAIILVDKNEKSVSSSDGHELMNHHVHRESRINHANNNFHDLLKVLKNGDFEKFSKISEREALDLHAMMMTSKPSFILLAPKSIQIIQDIRNFRNNSGLEITFTIDAGPNIHVLYSLKDSILVEKFLTDKYLLNSTVDSILFDCVGTGPVKVS